MGELDIVLNGAYGISYPIKGVMYRDVQWLDPDKYRLRDRKKPLPRIHECTVLQDALGDY
jgi:hypothetical protein